MDFLQGELSGNRELFDVPCACEPIASLSIPNAHDGLGGRGFPLQSLQAVDWPGGQGKLALR
jgi:hypothetical protein